MNGPLEESYLGHFSGPLMTSGYLRLHFCYRTNPFITPFSMLEGSYLLEPTGPLKGDTVARKHMGFTGLMGASLPKHTTASMDKLPSVGDSVTE